MLNQLREHGLAEVHASLSCLSENGSEMVVSRKIRFKSFLAEIAITPSGTIDYSQRSIFPRTAVRFVGVSRPAFFLQTADPTTAKVEIIGQRPLG